jgi:two-component system alkaline phosphatase synthesis response regulator PhoP
MTKHIFIIDDDTDILEALRVLLEFERYKVDISAKNGEVILEKIAKKLPDAIILDVLLSGHDGRVIARNLKSAPATKHIPIIMISAHPEAEESALKAGADEFLSKPFDMRELLSSLERVVEK